MAEKLEQQAQMAFPQALKARFQQIEQELRAKQLSQTNQHWLRQIQLEPEQLIALLDPHTELPRTVHLYHCDHLGTPLALINQRGEIDWQIELDAWGNVLSEYNPYHLSQPIRMQGQQYDEESGLHYNRYRYYDPQGGRYVTQDPIGLVRGNKPLPVCA